MLLIVIVSKGAALAILLTNANEETTQSSSAYVVRIAFWIGACVLPSFLYVSTYLFEITFSDETVQKRYLLIYLLLKVK